MFRRRRLKRLAIRSCSLRGPAGFARRAGREPWCWVRPTCALLAALLFSPAVGSAQVTASISGTVEDPAGMPVSGASVTVRSLDTGASRAVNTGDDGKFLVL